jgi:hypothetical protein
MIEARGRTGRKPTSAEKGGSAGGRGAGARGGSGSSKRSRYDKPPTWKGAGIRAVIAAVFVYVISIVLLGHHSFVSNLLLLPIVLAIYMPMIYYTDLWLYRRRQRINTKAAR